MSKQKLNFAKRVTVRLTPKHDGDGSVAQKRAELSVLINANKVNIDRACFINSDEEKKELKRVKSLHKELQAIQ